MGTSLPSYIRCGSQGAICIWDMPIAIEGMAELQVQRMVMAFINAPQDPLLALRSGVKKVIPPGFSCTTGEH